MRQRKVSRHETVKRAYTVRPRTVKGLHGDRVAGGRGSDPEGSDRSRPVLALRTHTVEITEPEEGPGGAAVEA